MPEVDSGMADRARGVAAVCVVSLPFFTARASCYPLLLVASISAAGGIPADTRHAYIEFAADYVIDDRTYATYRRFTGEPFLADVALLPLLAGWDSKRHSSDRDALLALLKLPREDADRLCEAFARYIERLALDCASYRVIGITATHFQLVPSLLFAQALARGPRAHRPSVVLGGYLSSPEAARSLLLAHPELDSVVFGEAEEGWMRACEAIQAGVRAVIRGGRRGFGTFPVAHDEVLYSISKQWIRSQLSISLELSRGCYWDKCDFCNFNAAYDGVFKSHRDNDVLDTMDKLHSEHGLRRFQFLDTALPRRFTHFLAREQIRRDYEVFVELRADLRYEELAALSNLGKVRVQLGIESLVEEHQAVMLNGATVRDNLNALRACSELGIDVVWGLMVGHPKETEDHLVSLLHVIPQLTSIKPPQYVTEFELRAGSPLWKERAALGVNFEFPFRVFDLILPPEPVNAEFLPVRTTAQYITREKQKLIGEIRDSVDGWQRAYAIQYASGLAAAT